MFIDRDALYVAEVRKDALATAERERLIRQMKTPRTPVRIPYQLWMNRLGARMIAWGQHLQARFAEPTLRGAA
jgi:hypothetical protein